MENEVSICASRANTLRRENEFAKRTAEVSRAKWIRVMALRFKLMPHLMTLIGFRDREKGENAKGKIP